MNRQVSTSPTAAFTYRVLPMGEFWEIALPGDSVPAGLFVRKADAIRRAHELARKQGKAAVLVYDPGGQVESEFYSD